MYAHALTTRNPCQYICTYSFFQTLVICIPKYDFLHIHICPLCMSQLSALLPHAHTMPPDTHRLKKSHSDIVPSSQIWHCDMAKVWVTSGVTLISAHAPEPLDGCGYEITTGHDNGG